MKNPSPEKVAEHFVSYICENRADSRHVRRVLSWIGFIVGGIDRLASEWGFWYVRQFWFKAGGKFYKVRYGHDIGFRGGIQIVEMLDGRTNGDVVLDLRDMAEAEEFYNRPTLAPSTRVRTAA